MPKLQQKIRNSQNKIHSVNLPIDVINETGWKKGDALIVKHVVGTDGKSRIVIVKEEDVYGRD